jgi:enoyl-CoA hydratase/carnithine racemase
MNFETIKMRQEGAVLFAEMSSPPMNLLEPELVRDLVSLIQQAEADHTFKVLVFKSADLDYFITIAQIEGRVRGAGGEFVLACDMRFASRESATFSQIEAAFGQLPGGGATQHLTRLMGRVRTLEVILSAEDYDAEMAERYGWINRALTENALGDFVKSLAHRIASFPAAGHVVVKDRINAIARAPAEDFRRDPDLFAEGLRNPETQSRIQAAMKRGFQTREAEITLAQMLGELAGPIARPH